MKKLLIFLLLALPAFGQSFNTNILPAQTGLTLGRNGQRWNLYGQNIHITGSFTAPVVTSSPTPATGYMNGYFKAGRGWCAKDSLGNEYCPGGGTTGGGSTSPGGSDTNLQYNNAGVFGGFPDGTANQVLHGGRTFSAVVEADQTLSDNTTANASIAKHGYAPKGNNDATYYLDSTLNWSVPAGTGGGGASTATTYIPLEDCTPDQTGNSFYSVASMTNWFNAHWEFTTNAASYINCKVRIPNTVAATPAASIVLEISANDNTSGHTANFQSCDAVATTGFQVSAPTCAANQAFTTTTTAYERVTKTYAVQSTVAANNLLVVKIATATTGTQPSANMIVYPYLKIDQNSVGGGGGSGTVTTFSAGDLAPLFTTAEANPSTTPALSFTLSNATAHTFFGNNTGSTAAPGFQAIGQGDITGLVAALALLSPKANSPLTGITSIQSLSLPNVAGLTQCLENDAAGITHGTGLPCASAGGGPASIKSMSSYPNAQAALTAIASGQTLLVDGTFTLCNGTLSAANVVLKGAGFQSGVLQCATANVPVLTGSGNGAKFENLKIQHITNTPISGGDGLVISPGTTSVRIVDSLIQNNYNNLVLGNTSFGVVEGNYIQFGQNHCLRFNSDGTSQVMQWLLKGNLFAQCLGDGVNFVLGAAISGLHITGPTIAAGNRAYGNGGKGYNFSASAATASGISDVFIGGQSFASYNNNSGLYMDLGSNGGRNAQITGFFSELSGQAVNTAGFNGGTTLVASGLGHGIEITSACDPTNPPQINGVETWQNSFSGAISACPGTQFINMQAYKNGMASSANSYERAAVAIRASRIRVTGTAHDNTSQQTYGVDISNSADVLDVSFTCGSTYTAANCIKKTTTPTTLTATLPGSISMGAATWQSGTGTPEGAIAAPVGSMFTRTDGGTSTSLYVKETGAATSTGWVAK